MDFSMGKSSLFGLRFWGLSACYTIGAALLLGIPTVLIPNAWFIRQIATSPLDYLIWGISVILIGPVLSLATLYPSPPDVNTPNRSGGGRTLVGALLTFLSVGCPVCNQLIVLLFGVGGAMTLFDPLRPFLGGASILILATTLFLRVRVLRQGCPIGRPSGPIKKNKRCINA